LNNLRERRRIYYEEYLSQRTGKLEYRFVRFESVTNELEIMGLNDDTTILDVGAGMCEFDFYLRTVRGFKGRYVPLDASIDGIDLENWIPIVRFDFVTGLEIIEHMRNPVRLIDMMKLSSRKGVVITTPNTDVLGEDGVVSMDSDHVSPIYIKTLEHQGLNVSERNFFGREKDSLLGVWNRQ